MMDERHVWRWRRDRLAWWLATVVDVPPGPGLLCVGGLAAVIRDLALVAQRHHLDPDDDAIALEWPQDDPESVVIRMVIWERERTARDRLGGRNERQECPADQ